ncbi:MAG: trypsin-like peptidase domain-containing protein [Holosporales bacterium]|nr:trypsin-like peptidase domain-containing protein [Holosporales bacterium]
MLLVLTTISVWEVCRNGIWNVVNYSPQIAEKIIRPSAQKNDKKQVTSLEENIPLPSSAISSLSSSSEFSSSFQQQTAIPVVTESSDINKDDEITPPSLEKGFSDIVRGAMHSVVNVSTMQIIKDESVPEGMEGMFKDFPFEDLFKDFFGLAPEKSKPRRSNSLGSGFIVRVDKAAEKAYIVTNYHVVEKAKKIVLSLYDKTEIPAETYAYDQRIDVAVLCIDTKILGNNVNKLVPITWGDSDSLEVGNWVVAIGNPFGLGNTVTHGIVSGKGRNINIAGKSSLSLIDEFIQHSAQINMGNSGGCLLNMKGNVVGINNAIFSMSGGNIGIGFAIPSNIVSYTVEQLIENRRTFRGWLGAEVQLLTPKQAESVGIDTGQTLDGSRIFGAFVANVVPNGPAERAGIKRGDIILEFNGTKITERNSLQKIVGASKIDSTVKAKLWHQNEGDKGWKETTVSIKVGDFEEAMKEGMIDSSKTDSLGTKKEEEEIPEIGITISKIPEKMKGAIAEEFFDNILVTKVDETKLSTFFETLFIPGDIIISVNNIKVTTVEEFQKIIKNIKNDKTIRTRPIPFLVVRGKSMVILATSINFDNNSNGSSTESVSPPKVTEIPNSHKKE